MDNSELEEKYKQLFPKIGELADLAARTLGPCCIEFVITLVNGETLRFETKDTSFYLDKIPIQ